MRTLMKVQMGTEAASEAIRNGTMQTTLQSAMEQLSPEAAYFTAQDMGYEPHSSSLTSKSRLRSQPSPSPSSSPSKPRSTFHR